MVNNTAILLKYKGLPNGHYHYDFIIDDNFFSNLEYSEFKQGNLSLGIDAEKQNDIFKMHITLDGKLKVCCDRCLDYFYIPVFFEGTVFASEKNNLHVNEENDEIDVIEIDLNKTEINLSHYIYESIYLSLPVQKLHPDDEFGNSTCNKEMLKILMKHSISDKEFDKNSD